jgi:hypothetical protein
MTPRRLARLVVLVVFLTPFAGCGGSTVSGSSVGPVTEHLTIRVTGPAESTPKEGCFLFLTAGVEGGGAMRYCLEEFTGAPGPDALVRDSGLLSFDLGDGTMQARVRISQKFAADGRHARQTLTGTVTGGTGRYSGARGTIGGGGTVDEHPPGRIADSDLRYTVILSGAASA